MIDERVSHYRVVAELGAGGMGVVYRAEDSKLGRQVALKFLPEEMSEDPQALERFRREARAASSLNHPNICTIYDIDEHRGRPFIAMELLEGRTLQERIPAGPVPLDEVIRIGIEIAGALEAAHEAGMIHRDIKPANIFLTDRGQAKILDFGLAKTTGGGVNAATARPTETAGHGPLTREGTAMGTIAYMSPEQARGEELDPRTDLFSFGALLYELVTARPAFSGNTTAVIFDAILHGTPVPAGQVRPEVPPELLHIIDKALEKDRAVRYQSAADLGADLKRLRRDTETSRAAVTPAGGVAAAPPRGTGRWRGVALVMAVAVIVAVAGWLWSRRRDSVPARSGPVTVAVLPLQNLGAGPEHDHLALAVPDEIVTSLSGTPSLAVRPFSMTRRYAGADLDPAAAAAELGVAHLVTGHYSREGDDLRLSLEAIDVEENRVLWKGGVLVPGGDMITLREKVSDSVRRGMLPALGVAAGETAAGTRPTNAEAYELYLRGVAFSGDLEPNRQAIRVLERAVQLDSSYAPAWAELAKRYYDEALYGTEDPAAQDRLYELTEEAAQRALALDPGLLQAAQFHIVVAVEHGRLEQAYDEAAAFLARRPDTAIAHFNLSYVYRYAGLLEEAAAECDTALSRDPTDPALRSCGNVFRMLARHDRARQFYALDPGSVISLANRSAMLLSEGRTEDALAVIRSLSQLRPDIPRTMTEACVEGRPEPEIADLARREAQRWESLRDPENHFGFAARLAYCGQRELSLRLLRRAIEGGFCSYPAMDRVTLFDNVRDEPEFAELRELGRACRQRFLDHRAGSSG